MDMRQWQSMNLLRTIICTGTLTEQHDTRRRYIFVRGASVPMSCPFVVMRYKFTFYYPLTLLQIQLTI